MNNNDKIELIEVIIITLIVGSIFIYSNEKPTGIYDELLANGHPHHELIESGYPFVARGYWTQCTTDGYPNTIWYPSGIIADYLFSFCIVFTPYILGTMFKSALTNFVGNTDNE